MIWWFCENMWLITYFLNIFRLRSLNCPFGNMEARGIQVLFVLKWISPIIYWFFYFTRSFRIFSDPKSNKLSKTLTQSCRVHNRIIFTESFLLLMMWIISISHNSSWKSASILWFPKKSFGFLAALLQNSTINFIYENVCQCV